MSKYYRANRAFGLFQPGSPQAYKLSRSKLDLFLNCPRCFYMDRRLGVGQPPGFPFALNSAVDFLLKREFDMHRAAGTAHPLMLDYGLKAVPLQDGRLEGWRDSLRRGVQFWDRPSNFLLSGGIDDVWVDEFGRLIVVDYKATAKSGTVGLDADWQIAYKRQMEVYQWLFRQNGFEVSETGYFVYCNGDLDREEFNARLEFKISLVPYVGQTSWIEPALMAARRCLEGPGLPPASRDCDFCAYRAAAQAKESNESSAPVKRRQVRASQAAALF